MNGFSLWKGKPVPRSAAVTVTGVTGKKAQRIGEVDGEPRERGERVPREKRRIGGEESEISKKLARFFEKGNFRGVERGQRTKPEKRGLKSRKRPPIPPPGGKEGKGNAHPSSLRTPS